VRSVRTRFHALLPLFRAAFAAAFLATACIAVTACARAATPAELQDWGTRTYAGTSRAAAFKACVTAVRSLGYDVAMLDANAGRVRTAPKVVLVTVVGNQYSAQAASSSLAWDIDIGASADGIVIHATPRGYHADQEVPATSMNAAYFKKAFETLFSEIERDMGVVPAAPAASSGHS
jgi:hypothetical protein